MTSEKWDLTKMPCDCCGKVGRPKETMEADYYTLAYYCHDEEKSCYNYVLLRKAA